MPMQGFHNTLRGEKPTFENGEAVIVKKTLKNGNRVKAPWSQGSVGQPWEKDKAMRTDVGNINCETGMFHQTQN